MSHGDRLECVPPGFRLTGSTANTRAAVIEDKKRKFFGVQFHPEVIHTKEGLKVLGNFLFKQAGLKPDWTISSFVGRKVKEIRATVGKGRVICGLSGGVDSLVTSLIIHKAIGRQLTCIFIDNGLLRKGQYEVLMEAFRHKFALKVVGIDASDMFLDGSAASSRPSASARRSAACSSTSSSARPCVSAGRPSWPRGRSIPTSSSPTRSRGRRRSSSPTTTWAACRRG